MALEGRRGRWASRGAASGEVGSGSPPKYLVPVTLDGSFRSQVIVERGQVRGTANSPRQQTPLPGRQIAMMPGATASKSKRIPQQARWSRSFHRGHFFPDTE